MTKLSNSQIAHKLARDILISQEGHFFDLKGKDIQPAKLTRTISAFANTDGGEIFIGIDEDTQTGIREWRGFVNEEEANGHLQIFEALFPFGQDFSYNFIQNENFSGLVLQISVNKAPEIKNASDGTPYIRRGAQNLPVNTPEGLSRLKMQKGITSFENSTIAVEKEVVTNSSVASDFMREIVPTSEPEPWLKKQRLIIDDKPTVAGILLFSEEPQAIIPKRSGIKIYRYKTKEIEGRRENLAFVPITIEGPIYEQITNTVRSVVKIIEDISILGVSSLEKPKYPFEALHEIITNAVLHRDYSIADDIHVRVFDNRVEVESPGRLPAHITIENILTERYARNGNLVRVINKFPNPPNKDVGEGLNTAFQAMHDLQLKEPIIYQMENSVSVHIRHEPLASPEEIVMAYLENNEDINNSKGREVCHIGSENRMKRVFERLIESNLIERVPGKRGRAAAYRKKKS